MEQDKAPKLPKAAKLMLWCAAALLIAGAALLYLPGRAPAADGGAESAAADMTRAQEGCELLQTFAYERCEHVVTRRVAAPVELYGKALDDARALYPEWTITDFAPKLVKMERRVPIHCPDHMVLMPDGAGRLCVFQNQYGDALKLVSELETDVSSLSAAAREELEGGLGFDSLGEMEAWLESAES